MYAQQYFILCYVHELMVEVHLIFVIFIILVDFMIIALFFIREKLFLM